MGEARKALRMHNKNPGDLPMTLAIRVAAFAFLAFASNAWAHDRESDRDVTIVSTRNMSFGRVTVESAGTLTLSSLNDAAVTYGGGARRVSGGSISTARFVVEGGPDLSNGDAVTISLPSAFRL